MTSYDAVVVGAGVVGASTAYHLTREGVRTLLVDRRDPARATDAGAGILSTASDRTTPDPYDRFVAHAAAYYPTLIKALEEGGAASTGYAMCGTMTVAVSADEAAHFRQIKARLARWQGAREAGYSVLSRAEARARFPPLGKVHGALLHNQGARIDGHLLAQAMVAVARRAGLEVREADVSEVLIEDQAAAGIRIGEERIEAKTVVIATGAWSKALAERIGLRVPVEPQRGQIVHLDLPGQDTGSWPIVSGFGDHYLVSWPNGRVVAGATRESGSGFATHADVDGLMEVLGEALRIAPGLGKATIREIRVGLRPVSADGLPILGPAPGMRGLVFATGHGTLGLQLGPFSGKVLAEQIAGRTPEVAFELFGPGRFA